MGSAVWEEWQIPTPGGKWSREKSTPHPMPMDVTPPQSSPVCTKAAVLVFTVLPDCTYEEVGGHAVWAESTTGLSLQWLVLLWSMTCRLEAQ